AYPHCTRPVCFDKGDAGDDCQPGETALECGLMKPRSIKPRALPSLTREQLLALRDATLAISSDLSLADTLKRIVASAASLANAHYAALGVPDESGEYLAEFITTGMTPRAEARISHRPHGHGILGLILREGRSLRLRDLRRHPRSVGFPANHPPMKSFLGVPITHKGNRLGNLYLTDKRKASEFTANDQRLIEWLAGHAGI